MLKIIVKMVEGEPRCPPPPFFMVKINPQMDLIDFLVLFFHPIGPIDTELMKHSMCTILKHIIPTFCS